MSMKSAIPLAAIGLGLLIARRQRPLADPLSHHKHLDR